MSTVITPTENQVMRVRNDSVPTSLAGSIAKQMRQFGTVDLQAIGAGAVNQAIKALAIATLHMADEGKGVAVIPSFVTIDLEGESGSRTAMRLRLVPYAADAPAGVSAEAVVTA